MSTVVLAILGSAAPAWVDAQSVTVALSPASQVVEPGSDFEMDIDVTDAGLGFNGFTAVIQYDPAALTLVPQSPLSLQEGSYMTDVCGNTFHRFRAGASTDTITDILLCADVSLNGPGELYRLHFHASDTPQATTVQFLGQPKFYDAGLYVTPVVSSNADVFIGSGLGVGSPRAGSRLMLRVTPNPGVSGLRFSVESDRAGAETLSIVDSQGRIVRRFASDASGPSVHTIPWDGCDDAGARVPPGMYFATLSVAGRSTTTRFALLH